LSDAPTQKRIAVLGAGGAKKTDKKFIDMMEKE